MRNGAHSLPQDQTGAQAAWQEARTRIVKTDKIKMGGGHNQQRADREPAHHYHRTEIERRGDHFT